MKQEFGLPINKKAKEVFDIQKKNISKNGKLILTGQIEKRAFVQKLNKGEDLVYRTTAKATAGELNAVMIISAMMQKIITKFTNEIDPSFYDKAYNYLLEEVGNYNLVDLKENLEEQFLTSSKYLNDVLLIWLLNQNKAFRKYQIIFDDKTLKINNNYPESLQYLQNFTKEFPTEEFGNSDLVSFLLKPMLTFSDSIFEQLNFIKTYWKDFIDDELAFLLQGMDLLREENKIHFTGPGPAQIHEFNDEEYEKFTEDKDWMPHLILLAKSTYVWLEQLSQKYKIEVKKLDQIPIKELQLQASRGITGIWLIGIWQRSFASKRIKEINGDLDAIASAYSLEDYRIADDLGGESSLEILKRNATNVGIRIGCDMVPNHTGIDSKWIVEHPDWFLQLDHPPFPSYSFNGENISGKNEIQVKIEDHYFDKTDAAVVFQYVKDGNTRYIYHGNDGTSTPWNDTAQLNFILPEVRKAVSDKIIEIAKEFPIIRFDAAMTLAKKHVQRLWFPVPGSGGDIATRSEYGISKAEFDKLFPHEFWREVVDRAAIEAPDTLLLAEAFWMMEGYFVRTLGMHRVYNSAFMHMLKDEDNAKYRKSIFNILEFNPQILKRFVNFMSNPDEDTAIAQFGNDDKYFGVCLVMSTMPGLPMFAHGQIEGFTERYGMEFKKAKWQEKEDKHLIERHNREIFPLLNKRYLFSEVENFVLFDFVTENNELNENVFTYTNKFEDQHSLVVYNNKFQQTSGWITWASVPIKKDEETIWIRKNLGATWELQNDKNHFVIFKDVISGLEFIRNSKEIHERGLFHNLGAFKYAVYLNIYEVKDNESKQYAKLTEYLRGGGVENIQDSFKRIELLPLLKKFNEFWNVLPHLLNLADGKEYNSFKPELLSRIENFLLYLRKWINSQVEIEPILIDVSADLDFYFKLNLKNDLFEIIWILLRHLGKLEPEENYEQISAKWLDDFFFGEEIRNISKSNLNLDLDLLKITIRFHNLWQQQNLKIVLDSPEVVSYLNINEYDEKLWFNKEAFEKMINFLEKANLISIGIQKTERKKFKIFIEKVRIAAKSSDFQIEKLLEKIDRG